MKGKQVLKIKELAFAVIQKRKALGINARDLAESIGISASTLCRIEREGHCELECYVALILWLDVPFERFLDIPKRDDFIAVSVNESIPSVVTELLKYDESLTAKRRTFLSHAFSDLYRRLKDL